MTIWFFAFIVKYSNRKLYKNWIQRKDHLCVHIFTLKSDVTKTNIHYKKKEIAVLISTMIAALV